MVLFNKGDRVEVCPGDNFKNAIYGTVKEYDGLIYLVITQKGSRVVTRKENLKRYSEDEELILN